MAKVYIRACPIQPIDTLSLAASANEFIDLATGVGGLTGVNDIDFEFHNGVMYVIMKELD